MYSEPDNKLLAEVLHDLDVEASIVQPLKRTSRWAIVFEAVGIALLCFGIMWFLGKGIIWVSLFYAAVMTVSSAWLLIHTENKSFRMQEQLPKSGILEKIACGPREFEKIFDYTPWPWSLYILDPRPQHLRRWVKLVARNLDWYLAEPKLLIRSESIIEIGCLALIAFCILLDITSNAAPRLAGYSPMGMIIALMLPQGLFAGFVSLQRMRNAALLRDYLKDVLVMTKPK